MRNGSFALLVATLVAWPMLVSAAAKVEIGRFAGPRANESRGQLSRQLCKVVPCVSASAAGRTAQLLGKVSKVRGRLSLELVLADGGATRLRRALPLSAAGKLSPAQLAQVTRDVEAALSEPAPSRPPPLPSAARAPEPAPLVAPAGAERAFNQPSAVDAAFANAPADRAPVVEPQRGSPAAPEVSGPSWLRLSAGMEALARQQRVEGLETKGLKVFSGWPLFGLRLQLEATPLASVDSFIRGLGLEVGYTTTVATVAKEETETGTAEFPGRLAHLAAALAFRIPFGESGVALTPRVGYSQTSFATSASADGAEVQGLPDVDYSSVSAGATLEAALLEERLELRAGIAWLQVLSGGEIFSADYFPSGTARGLEAQARVAYRVLASVDLFVEGRYVRYDLAMSPGEDAPYIARSATDEIFGVSGGLGYRF